MNIEMSVFVKSMKADEAFDEIKLFKPGEDIIIGPVTSIKTN